MSHEPFRILLVEDNAADVYLFRKGLESAEVSFELTLLSDGAAALAFVRREQDYEGSPVPDLVVLDLNLPKNDGLEVLETMRASEQFSKVPVVIASSSSAPHARMKLERPGFERYIVKPPGLEAFLGIGAVLKQILLDHKSVPPPPAL